MEFFRGTYPAPAMKTACRMVFDRLHNGDTSEQPAVYRFNSRYGGGKTHTLAAACLHTDVVRQEPEETPIPSHLATDSVRLIAFTGENVDPLSGTELDDAGNRAKSLTGHVAYHLGGPQALEQFREHDNRLTDPGAENFRRLIGDQPTLILVDELVQWVDRVLQLGELNVQGIKTTIAALAKRTKPEVLKDTLKTLFRVGIVKYAGDPPIYYMYTKQGDITMGEINSDVVFTLVPV